MDSIQKKMEKNYSTILKFLKLQITYVSSDFFACFTEEELFEIVTIDQVRQFFKKINVGYTEKTLLYIDEAFTHKQIVEFTKLLRNNKKFLTITVSKLRRIVRLLEKKYL